MSPDLLVSSRSKLDRAEKQLVDLYAEMLDAIDPAKNPVRADIDAYPYPKPSGTRDARDWTAFTIYVTEAPSFTSDMGLLLGEVVHNFRGGLDHLAWELVHRVGRNRLKAKEAQRVAFPMAKNRISYWGGPGKKGRVDSLLPDVPTPFRTLIERYQPYRRTIAGRAMRNLRTLTDADKHRSIVPVLALPKEGDFDVQYFPDSLAFPPIQDLKFGREMKPGTKLWTIVIAGGEPGKRGVNMKGRIQAAPFFPLSLIRPNPDDDAALVEVVLNEIRDTCEEIFDRVRDHL